MPLSAAQGPAMLPVWVGRYVSRERPVGVPGPDALLLDVFPLEARRTAPSFSR